LKYFFSTIVTYFLLVYISIIIPLLTTGIEAREVLDQISDKMNLEIISKNPDINIRENKIFQGSENLIMKDHLMNRKFKGLSHTLYHPPIGQDCPRKIVVMSGKSNVGKTFFSAVFSWLLSLKNERILLIDCDFQNSKLGEYFKPFVDLPPLSGDKSIKNISKNLDLITATELLTTLSDSHQQSLSEYIDSISSGYRFVIIDTQTGLNDVNLELLIFADTGILISTADPSAILDTYMIIRGSLSHINSPDFRLVVNQLISDSNIIEMYDNLNTALSNFLNYEIGLIGTIPFDSSIDPVLNKFPFEFEDSSSVQEIEKIVNLVRTVKSKVVPVAGKSIAAPLFR
jgi:flagellar biosynthesis protein FlhG